MPHVCCRCMTIYRILSAIDDSVKKPVRTSESPRPFQNTAPSCTPKIHLQTTPARFGPLQARHSHVHNCSLQREETVKSCDSLVQRKHSLLHVQRKQNAPHTHRLEHMSNSMFLRRACLHFKPKRMYLCLPSKCLQLQLSLR